MGQQNFVPNGDFELFDTCPSTASFPGDIQIERCLGWTAPTYGTSDYFNSCANGNWGSNGNIWVPNNFAGYQLPHNGEGFSGIYSGTYAFTYFPCVDGDSSTHYREYIQTKLLSPLENGKNYKLSFFISLADSISGYAVKNIGALFTTNAIGFNCFKPIVANPQVKSPDFVTDMNGWTKVEGEFVAQGSEEYLTIGNFTDIAKFHLDTLCVKPNTDWQNGDGISYYYIDGISLIESEVTYSVPNVITPNGDGVNEAFFVNFPFEKMIITNRWGNVVYESDIINSFWDGRNQNGDICSDGVYFYVIELKKDKRLTGFIQLLK